MGTSSKNTAKTAAVMNLISRRPAEKIVSESGTTGQGPSSALQADDQSGSESAAREQIEYIDIDRIDDDPRNFYELSGLDELAANIELLGLQQPIRVRPGEEPGRYVIVSGHRRRAPAGDGRPRGAAGFALHRGTGAGVRRPSGAAAHHGQPRHPQDDFL